MSTALHRAPVAHRQLIASLVAARVGCEPGSIPGAPLFRYVPSEEPAPLIDDKPSSRGSVPGVSAFRLKHYRPASLSLAPCYQIPMAGDSAALTDARLAWHGGDPGPLREYLQQARPAEPEPEPEPEPELSFAAPARRAAPGIVRTAARKARR